MFGLFLAFYDASGERLLKKLEINSFWLPSAAPKNAIEFQVNAQTGVLIGKLRFPGMFAVVHTRRDLPAERDSNAHQLR